MDIIFWCGSKCLGLAEMYINFWYGPKTLDHPNLGAVEGRGNNTLWKDHVGSLQLLRGLSKAFPWKEPSKTVKPCREIVDSNS